MAKSLRISRCNIYQYLQSEDSYTDLNPLSNWGHAWNMTTPNQCIRHRGQPWYLELKSASTLSLRKCMSLHSQLYLAAQVRPLSRASSVMSNSITKRHIKIWLIWLRSNSHPFLFWDQSIPSLFKERHF